MLTGFNTNTRHRGVLFHIQTEDSGKANPHVITHLFHGGNILSSLKQKYTEKLESETLEDDVRKLMEKQHKGMIRSLKSGFHDELIAERLGPSCFEDTLPAAPPPVASDTTETVTETDTGGDTASEIVSMLARNASEQKPARRRVAKERSPRTFGEGIDTDRPLDEVVLDYLVQNARKRKRRRQ